MDVSSTALDALEATLDDAQATLTRLRYQAVPMALRMTLACEIVAIRDAIATERARYDRGQGR